MMGVTHAHIHTQHNFFIKNPNIYKLSTLKQKIHSRTANVKYTEIIEKKGS